MLGLGITFAISSLSGCSYFLGPKAENSKPMEINNGGLECLDEIGTDFETWVKTGGVDPARPVHCVVSALDQFAAKTTGQNESGWSQKELARFFATYLEKKGKDPNLWLKEALRLKQAVIGGSEDDLSREELNRIREWLNRSIPNLQALSRSASALFFQVDRTDRVDLESALTAIRELTESLAQEIHSSPREGRIAFNTSSISALLERMEISAPGFVKLLPMVESLKTIVIGGEPDSIQPAEWPSLVRTMGRIWITALRVRYQISDNERALDRDFRYVEAATKEGLEILTGAVASQGQSRSIPLSKWERVVELAEGNGLLPFGLSGNTIKGLLPHVFGKLLYGVSRNDHGEKSKGFGDAQLAVLKRIRKDWIESQSFIAKLADARSEFEALEVAEALQGSGPSWRVQLAVLTGEARPLHADEEGRMRIVSREEGSRLTLSDLNRINGVRAAAAAVLAGYAHDVSDSGETQGLTEQEAQDVYLDVRSLGRELGLVDARNTTAGIRTFMEANIFTSVSVGDSRISLVEAVEWFHLAVGGGVIAGRIHEDMLEECGLDKIDVLGKRKLNTDCFRKRFRERFGTYFANLPHFAKWYAEGGDARAAEVQRFVERSARSVGYSDRPIDTAELRAITPVLHYVENVFATRDNGNKGYLDSREVWEAYPVIQPFIKKVTGGKVESEALQKAIFSWLIVFGEPPSSDWLGGGKVLGWALARHAWSEKASRLDILKIIASFATVTAVEREKRIAEFFRQKQIWLRRDIAKGDRATTDKLAQLFQCQPTSYADFAEDLRTHVDKIIPLKAPGSVDAPKFIESVKEIISSDERLEFYCLPF